MRACVVAIGNPWASDDGVGPEVVRRLQAEMVSADVTGQGAAEHPLELNFVTLQQVTTGLIELAEQYDLLILVDAVSSGAPPGTIHREVWRPDLAASRGVERASSHGLGVRELLKLAASLGRLRAEVFLWGIEIGSTEPGPQLSPSVAVALPILVDQLRRELREMNRREVGLTGDRK